MAMLSRCINNFAHIARTYSPIFAAAQQNAALGNEFEVLDTRKIRIQLRD